MQCAYWLYIHLINTEVSQGQAGGAGVFNLRVLRLKQIWSLLFA